MGLFVCIPLVPFHFLNLNKLSGPLFLGAQAVRFAPFGVGLIIGVLWAARVLRRREWPGPLAGVLVGLFLVQVLSSLGSIDPLQSLTKAVYYFTTGELLGLAAASSFGDRAAIRHCLGVGIVGAVLVSVYGLVDYGYHLPYLREDVFALGNPLMTQFHHTVPRARAIATIGNPLPLGTYLVLICPFFFLAVFQTRRKLIRTLAVIGIALVVGLLFCTFSRGAWIGFFAGTALFFWLERSKYLIAVAILGLLFLAGAREAEVMQQRNLFDQLVFEHQTYHRTRSFDTATAIWAGQPLWGTGTGTYRYHSRSTCLDKMPDNMYATILVETGLLGLAGHLFFFCALLHGLWRLRGGWKPPPALALTWEDRGMAHAFLACLVGLLVNLATWDALYFPLTRSVSWILAGLALAFVRLFDQERAER